MEGTNTPAENIYMPIWQSMLSCYTYVEEHNKTYKLQWHFCVLDSKVLMKMTTRN